MTTPTSNQLKQKQVLVQTSLAKTDLEEHPPLRALRSKADGGKGLQDGNLGDFPKVGKIRGVGHFCWDIFVGFCWEFPKMFTFSN